MTVGKAVQPSANSTNIILNRPTYGAAVNSKVEKSRSIESQIKTLRQRNTFEANLLIDYLQSQMKKQCESTLNKIQIETSATIGMASSMVGGTVGFIGGVIWGVGKDIKGDGFSYGYKDFNERFVNPTLQNIRDSVSDKDAYDVGYLVGTVVPVASGIMGIVDKAGKISSTIRIADTLGDVALAGTVIDSSSAMSLINSIVQASVGIGVGGTSDNNNPSATELKFESDTKSAQKLNNEMEKRGWTKDTVKDTVNNPHTTRKSTYKANGNSATVYYKENGAYVVVDDVTKEVVQVSDNINPSAWTPDSGIIDPYKP